MAQLMSLGKTVILIAVLVIAVLMMAFTPPTQSPVHPVEPLEGFVPCGAKHNKCDRKTAGTCQINPLLHGGKNHVDEYGHTF